VVIRQQITVLQGPDKPFLRLQQCSLAEVRVNKLWGVHFGDKHCSNGLKPDLESRDLGSSIGRGSISDIWFLPHKNGNLKKKKKGLGCLGGSVN